MSVPVMAAVAAGALVLGAPVLVAASAATAGARAASAADSAALAAADTLIGVSTSGNESDPCSIAAEIVALHGATLNSCVVSDATLDVRVEAGASVGPIVLTRTARAGPPNTAANGRSHTQG